MLRTDYHSFPVPTNKDRFWPLFCPKPTVKVLFYTDSGAVQMDKSTAFGLGILKEWIQTGNPFFVDVQIDFLNRHDPTHANNKLTASLLV